MLRDSLVGSSRRCCWGAEVPLSRSSQNTHRIGRPSCLENPNPAWAEYSLTESAPSPFHAEPEQYSQLAVIQNRAQRWPVQTFNPLRVWRLIDRAGDMEPAIWT